MCPCAFSDLHHDLLIPGLPIWVSKRRGLINETKGRSRFFYIHDFNQLNNIVTKVLAWFSTELMSSDINRMTSTRFQCCRKKLSKNRTYVSVAACIRLVLDVIVQQSLRHKFMHCIQYQIAADTSAMTISQLTTSL